MSANAIERAEMNRFRSGKLPCEECGCVMYPTMSVGCGYYRFTCRNGHQAGATWPYGWADDKPSELVAWKEYEAFGYLLVKWRLIPRAWDSVDGTYERRFGLWHWKSAYSK